MFNDIIQDQAVEKSAAAPFGPAADLFKSQPVGAAGPSIQNNVAPGKLWEHSRIGVKSLCLHLLQLSTLYLFRSQSRRLRPFLQPTARICKTIQETELELESDQTPLAPIQNNIYLLKTRALKNNHKCKSGFFNISKPFQAFLSKSADFFSEPALVGSKLSLQEPNRYPEVSFCSNKFFLTPMTA